MAQRAPAVCLLLLFFTASAEASSVEWLTAHDPEQASDLLLEGARSPDGVQCLALLQGFIVGGYTSDSVTAHLEDHADAADLTACDTVREALVHSFPCSR